MHIGTADAVEYVNGQAHTNGLENFWSLLKRGISGTYVSVEPFYLFRYLDEQTYRYNQRKNMTDFDRFKLACSQVVGNGSHGMFSRASNRTNICKLTDKESKRQNRGKRKSS